MVKVLTFIKRKPGMAVEEFQRYWLTRHPAVVTRLPGVRRYVQSHTDDTNALRARTHGAEHEAVQADEAEFIDRATMGLIVTEEHVVVSGPVGADAVKAVEFLNRRPGTSVDDFQGYWRERHAPHLAAVPGLRRCVLSATRRSAYTAGRAPAYDGVTLMWFDSADALRAAAGSPAYVAAVADREQFLAPGSPPFIMTREHVIAGGDP